MGSLILSSCGPVYAGAQIFSYSVEKHPTYAPVLRPLWEAVARGDLEAAVTGTSPGGGRRVPAPAVVVLVKERRRRSFPRSPASPASAA